jgi:hypothetical protein
MPEIRNGKAILQDAEGNLVQVAPSEAAERIKSGLFFDAPQEAIAQADAAAAEQARLDELQTPGAVANTALQTASRAITAPIDWTANKLGISQTPINNLGQTSEQAAWTNERVRQMQEANPIAAGVGEVGGQLTAAAAMGLGAGAGALSTRLATGALARTAIRAGVEGAAFGAMGAMEDPNASAQHVLAAGGLGLLLGAGGGAALHGAGVGLQRVFGRSDNALVASAIDATERQAETEAAVRPSRLESIFGKAAREGSNAPEELLREVGPGGTRTREAIQAADHFDTFVDDTAKAMTNLANETTNSVDRAVERVRSISLKEEGLRKLITPEVDTVERRALADELVKAAYSRFDEATAGLADMEAGEGVGLPIKSRNQLNVARREFEQTYVKMVESQDLAQRFELVDVLKKRLDELTKTFRKDAVSKRLSYTESEGIALQDAATQINELNDELRGSLESSRIWGSKLAAAQKEVNAIWHHGGVDAMKEFGKEFQRKTVREEFATGRDIWEVDPNELASLLRNPQGHENQIRLRAMTNYLDKMEDLVGTIGEKYEVGTQMRTAQEKLSEMRKMFEQAKDRAELANKWKELETYKATGKTALASTIVGALPLMGKVGQAINAAASPATTARFLDTISSQAQKRNQSSIIDSVGKWIRSGATSAASGISRGQPALTSAAVSVFRGNHKSDQEATDARLQALYKADPAALGQHLQGVSDSVLMQAGAVSSNAISYLRSVVPPYLTRPNLMQPGRKMVMSLPDQIKFGRIWGTVTDPSTAVKDLKAGRLMPSQVEALQTVYPSIYDDLRNQTIEALGAADARGVQIPIQVRAQLSLLLGLDGANEPAMTDDFAAKVRSLIAANEQRKPPPGNNSPHASSKLAASRRSPFDQEIKELES